jgi:hypothetical protein
MTKSFSPRGRPSQVRSYRSSNRLALLSKSGSRGRIQQRCCQGRIASSCSQRHKVLSLIVATKPWSRAYRANSGTLQRAKGCSRREGSSQAKALICTTSSGGGKPGSARSWYFLQPGQPFGKEAFSPPTDDLPGCIQALGDLVIGEPLGREKNHPRANHLYIW